MKAENSGFVQILIVVLFLIGLGSLGLYYISSRSNNLALSLPTPSPTQSLVLYPTSIPDPTANWKTYTNTYYKFQIRYPQDWNGPVRVSGDMKSGQATFEGNEGQITLYWGGGFGGGPCPSERTTIKTKMGDIGFCVYRHAENVEQLKIANDIALPTNFPSLSINADINSPATTNEARIKEIISTFKLTN